MEEEEVAVEAAFHPLVLPQQHLALLCNQLGEGGLFLPYQSSPKAVLLLHPVPCPSLRCVPPYISDFAASSVQQENVSEWRLTLQMLLCRRRRAPGR